MILLLAVFNMFIKLEHELVSYARRVLGSWNYARGFLTGSIFP
jgi:hypothetical protein